MFRWLFLAVLLALPRGAWATPGDDLITAMDEIANRATDTFFRFEALTQEPGKAARTMTFSVQNKGQKRLVEFEAPGDMKGTRVLVLSRQQMYVYLPAYKKVRRVASHVTEQGFMGTTYSDEDMSTTRFGMVYSTTVLAKTEDVTKLELRARDGEKSNYLKLEIDLKNDLGLPSEIRYFNLDGQHIKTEVRDKYDCGQDICTPGEMTMTDLRRAGVWTRLSVTERRVNQGVGDATFSVRNLERGR
jgi:hypothetical protein